MIRGKLSCTNKVDLLCRNKDWLYQKYWIEKLSTVATAKLCDCHDTTVSYWLIKFGLGTRSRLEAHILLLPQKRERFRRYGEEKKNKSDIEIYGEKKAKEKGERLSETMRYVWKENPSSGFTGGTHTEKTKRKISQGVVEAIVDGRIHFKRPTSLELLFDKMTPDSIRYVGDGAFWVTLKNGMHRNPDFKIHKQNKVIEVFGDYWHKGENPQNLIGQYVEAGFQCLVVWEREVYNEPTLVLEAVVEFMND